jgi:CsoR family transcriptional regulator, copper-sensing transcriptional repressor
MSAIHRSQSGIPGGSVWQNRAIDADDAAMANSPKIPGPSRRAPGGCAVAEGADDRRNQHKRGVVLRLRRAEGQIRGVLRMIENDEPCQDIAQQLAAVRKALDRAFFEMMACTLESEIGEISDSPERQERMTEMFGILSKYA